ncbi:transporter [Rhodanobacter lindaniclasticus]
MLTLITTLPARADNPGFDRPGFGFTPAVLAAGDIAIEQGLPDWSRDRQDGISVSQYTADSLLRIGIGGPWELQLGSASWNALRQSGPAGTLHRYGRGDSQLGLKLALPSTASAFSWGLLGNVTLTDGSRDFRGDHRQYLLGAQFDLAVGARHSLGLYLENVRSGGTDSRTVAINDSFALTPALTLYTEAAWQHAPIGGNGSLAGAGVQWMVTPRVQLDAGFDHRLGGNANEWQTNLGVSVYFGR